MTVTKRKPHIPFLLSGIFLGLLLCICLFMCTPLFEVSLAKDSIQLELGEEVSTDPAYYLDGANWCVPLSFVDPSSLSKKDVGNFTVSIYHGFKKYTCHVTVVDTTPPEITKDVKNITVKMGETVSVSSLGLKIKDYSDIQSTAFTKITSTKFRSTLSEEKTKVLEDAFAKGIDILGEEFQFDYGGIYTLTISASDVFHNSSETDLTITVEEPPVLEVAKDFYVSAESELDFTEYITTWDFLDEDYGVDDVKIDTSSLNLTSPGEYPVTFSGTDDYGLRTTVSSTVHVYSEKGLQELINTHTLNTNDHTIIGALNPYDSGYYLDNNPSFIQEAMLPTIVHIENDALATMGSGYIIDINDSFVTLATNHHVIMDDMSPEITFFDSTKCVGSVVASDPRNDIAFIRIPIDGSSTETSLSSNIVKTLRTVHINKKYWEDLPNEAKLDICYNCINIDGEIWQSTIGTLVEKSSFRDWNEYTNIYACIISPEPIAGTSGSAIFDGHGRLIAMVRGYTTYPDYVETVAVPLKQILDYYEKVFEEPVHYQ